MIFKIDSSLNNVKGKSAKELADLILHISNAQHNISCNPDMWKWVNEHLLVNEYLSNWDVQLIKSNKQLRDITYVKSRYLSTVTIGLQAGMFTPAEADKLISHPSLVIVENEQNDWAVIRTWIDLLKNDRNYKDVNTIVCKRKDANEFRAYNAGSSGQIVNTVTQRQTIYGRKATPYKVTILIDSDKCDAVADFSNEKKKIIQAMAKAGIEGHILHKREMENYFTEANYRAAGIIVPSKAVPVYTDEEWDFIDIENASFTNYKKKQLPMVAQYLDKLSLLSRVDVRKVTYNGEIMNEIQMIILKFAKLC